MAIKNTLLGGTDWIDGEVLNAVDINDTFDKVAFKFDDTKNTVLRGCEIIPNDTVSSTNLNNKFAIKEGWFYNSNNIIIKINAQSDLILSAPDATLRRIDLITVSDTGVITVTDGTPNALPVFPTVPTNHTILGYIHRLEGTVSGNMVVDYSTINDSRLIVGEKEDFIYGKNDTKYAFNIASRKDSVMFPSLLNKNYYSYRYEMCFSYSTGGIPDVNIKLNNTSTANFYTNGLWTRASVYSISTTSDGLRMAYNQETSNLVPFTVGFFRGFIYLKNQTKTLIEWNLVNGSSVSTDFHRGHGTCNLAGFNVNRLEFLPYYGSGSGPRVFQIRIYGVKNTMTGTKTEYA
jgi:hypothetical protein